MPYPTNPEVLKCLDYITCDEDGFMNGVREDAPDEIKELYKEWMEEKEEWKRKGIK